MKPLLLMAIAIMFASCGQKKPSTSVWKDTIAQHIWPINDGNTFMLATSSFKHRFGNSVSAYFDRCYAEKFGGVAAGIYDEDDVNYLVSFKAIPKEADIPSVSATEWEKMITQDKVRIHKDSIHIHGDSIAKQFNSSKCCISSYKPVSQPEIGYKTSTINTTDSHITFIGTTSKIDYRKIDKLFTLIQRKYKRLPTISEIIDFFPPGYFGIGSYDIRGVKFTVGENALNGVTTGVHDVAIGNSALDN